MSSSPKTILTNLKNELEQLILSINTRALAGENKRIKIKNSQEGKIWTLPYKKQDYIVNNPFYNKIEQVGIYDLMMFVQSKIDYLSVFQKSKAFRESENVNKRLIIPALIANGTNMGIHRMSKISDVKYSQLQLAEKNYIEINNLKMANKLIADKTMDLPIFDDYNILSNIHGATDGQKKEVIRKTIKTRYSSKYFGAGKGVVVMTLLANHVPINAMTISPNEHESQFVFQLFYNNQSNIDPLVCSVDTAGTNKLNFSLFFFINKIFAPRYKRLTHKANTIHGFKNLNCYNDLVIKPSGQIKEKLISAEWDNVQRIIASVLLKETDQSTLIRQLNSSYKKDSTKLALWEFEKILMSIYLLKYIDDESLRMSVQRSLNRVESFHQLKSYICLLNGKFRGIDDDEIELWSECARLISNCLIYYNSVILSELIVKYEKSGNAPAVELVKKLSPVAWQHINFLGKYSFTKGAEAINIENILSFLKPEDLEED